MTADGGPATGVLRAAFDWIGSVATADGGWCEHGEASEDLYSGTAGVLFGCAEATAYGTDVGRVADRARNRLLAVVAGEAGGLPDDGLFSGWSGIAVALRAWAAVTGDVEAGTAATAVMDRVADRALHLPPDPDRYLDVISGDAGLLLALLAGDSPAALAAAHAVADRLVALGEPTDTGLQWPMVRNYPGLMPGLSHGTAGVAYALAAAGRWLARADLISVAVRGAGHLLSLGHTPQGWALPLIIPRQAHRPPVNFGWCHGPTGTVRLFLLLHDLDPQPRWDTAITACLAALRDSRLPARLYPGYWDNLGRCCGTAGVGQLLLDRYQATGDRQFLDWATTLGDDVLSRAVHTPAGITWSNTEHTATPPELPPEPGFMQGSAGIAGWLSRLAAAQRGADVPAVPTGVEPSWL